MDCWHSSIRPAFLSQSSLAQLSSLLLQMMQRHRRPFVSAGESEVMPRCELAEVAGRAGGGGRVLGQPPGGQHRRHCGRRRPNRPPHRYRNPSVIKPNHNIVFHIE